MMPFVVIFLSGLAIFLSESVSLAQSNDARPTLIGGKPADPKDFPASVVASMNGAVCTATVVGERVLLIASHCVNHNASAKFTVGANQYHSICARSPLYRNGTDHDLALCLTDRSVTGIAFESINIDQNLLKVGDTLQLTGYGCTRQGGGGGNDGVYRIGEAKITRLPSGSSYDIVTQGQSALCFGDSGGPAFKYLDAAKSRRVVVSANSKGNISDTSYLADTSTQASIKFINEWSSQNNVRICGVHADAAGCRAGPAPEQDQRTAECRLMAQAEAFITWKNCLESASKPDVQSCDKANDLIQNCYATKQ